MDYALTVALQVGSAVASLIIISLGLAVIFGMMRIINFAHGEFIMLGGFATITATNAGLSLWVGMLVVAPLTVGIIGMVLERLIIRHLYGRMVDTMLATWGISLALIGAVSVIYGNTVTGVSAPLGSIEIGAYRAGAYDLFLIGMAVVLVVAGWLFLKYTRAGLIGRGTMQNASMAAALGINQSAVYSVTFGVGAAVSGLAGGLLAPVSGVVPTIGIAYIAKAFITVISGGAALLTGTVSASGLLGSISTATSFVSNPVIGEVALLIAAIVLIRVLPEGVTGRFFRRSL